MTGAVGVHDPTIVKEKDRYYRFATGDGIEVSVSRDLKHWETPGKVFSRNPDWTSWAVPGSTWFWAPEVVYRQGRWRLYYSVSTFGSQTSAIGLVTNATLDDRSPNFGWTDEGLVLASSPVDDFNAIDPAMVADDAGEDWFLWGSFWGGLKLTRLDSTTGKLPSTRQPIYTVADRQRTPNTVEGGYILRRDGWYYLFCSFDFCCRGLESTYRIVVGRSREVTGPYLDRQGVSLAAGGGSVLRCGTDDPRYAALGHNSIFVENDDQYLVCHGYDKRREGAPSLVLEKLLWDDHGWPVAPGQLNKQSR